MKCKLRAVWYFLTSPAAWTGVVRFSGHRFDYENRKNYREGDEQVEEMTCVDCGYTWKSYWEKS